MICVATRPTNKTFPTMATPFWHLIMMADENVKLVTKLHKFGWTMSNDHLLIPALLMLFSLPSINWTVLLFLRVVNTRWAQKKPLVQSVNNFLSFYSVILKQGTNKELVIFYNPMFLFLRFWHFSRENDVTNSVPNFGFGNKMASNSNFKMLYLLSG